MASKRRIRRKSCEGKVRYYEQPKAEIAARVLSAKRREAFHSYRCDFGGHWHIAHSKQGGKFVVFDNRFAKV
jgi:hypothetical protein